MKKIFCTVGPSSLNKLFLKNAEKFKVSLLRINLSHTSLGNLPKVIEFIKSNCNIPICIDTEGAQIRSKVKKRKYLKKGSIINITPNMTGNSFSLYPYIAPYIKRNTVLDIGFENLKMKVISKIDKNLKCKIISGGILDKNKGIHLINQNIKLPPLTTKDLKAIKIAKSLKIKYYALSFTNSLKDVIFFNNLLKKEHKIFKIETKSGIRNLRKIFSKSDKIIIDRGDLSKDMNLINIPLAQRKIHQISNSLKNKKVYVATNLLESMIVNPYPTRAELNDIFNCLELGSEGLVLAAETAIGKWPIKCIDIMRSIIKTYESKVNEFR